MLNENKLENFHLKVNIFILTLLVFFWTTLYQLQRIKHKILHLSKLYFYDVFFIPTTSSATICPYTGIIE